MKDVYVAYNIIFLIILLLIVIRRLYKTEGYLSASGGLGGLRAKVGDIVDVVDREYKKPINAKPVTDIGNSVIDIGKPAVPVPAPLPIIPDIDKLPGINPPRNEVMPAVQDRCGRSPGDPYYNSPCGKIALDPKPPVAKPPVLRPGVLRPPVTAPPMLRPPVTKPRYDEGLFATILLEHRKKNNDSSVRVKHYKGRPTSVKGKFVIEQTNNGVNFESFESTLPNMQTGQHILGFKFSPNTSPILDSIGRIQSVGMARIQGIICSVLHSSDFNNILKDMEKRLGRENDLYWEGSPITCRNLIQFINREISRIRDDADMNFIGRPDLYALANFILSELRTIKSTVLTQLGCTRNTTVTVGPFVDMMREIREGFCSRVDNVRMNRSLVDILSIDSLRSAGINIEIKRLLDKFRPPTKEELLRELGPVMNPQLPGEDMLAVQDRCGRSPGDPYYNSPCNRPDPKPPAIKPDPPTGIRPASLAPQHNPQIMGEIRAQMDVLDKDNDKFLTIDDLENSGVSLQDIKGLMQYDFNKDGKLSGFELTDQWNRSGSSILSRLAKAAETGRVEGAAGAARSIAEKAVAKAKAVDVEAGSESVARSIAPKAVAKANAAAVEADESTPALEIINNENMSTEEKSAAVVNDFLQKNPDATEEDVAEVAQIVAEEDAYLVSFSAAPGTLARAAADAANALDAAEKALEALVPLVPKANANAIALTQKSKDFMLPLECLTHPHLDVCPPELLAEKESLDKKAAEARRAAEKAEADVRAGENAVNGARNRLAAARKAKEIGEKVEAEIAKIPFYVEIAATLARAERDVEAAKEVEARAAKVNAEVPRLIRQAETSLAKAKKARADALSSRRFKLTWIANGREWAHRGDEIVHQYEKLAKEWAASTENTAKNIKQIAQGEIGVFAYDKNNDNFLTEEELKNGGAPTQTINMLMGFDFNEDGKLSLSEIKTMNEAAATMPKPGKVSKPKTKSEWDAWKASDAGYESRLRNVNNFGQLVIWEFVYAVSGQDEDIYQVYGKRPRRTVENRIFRGRDWNIRPKNKYSRYHKPSYYRYQGLRNNRWDTNINYEREKYYYQWDRPPTKADFVADTKKKLKVSRIKEIMLDYRTNWARDNAQIFDSGMSWRKNTYVNNPPYKFDDPEKIKPLFEKDWIKNKTELTLDEFHKLYVDVVATVGVKKRNNVYIMKMNPIINTKGHPDDPKVKEYCSKDQSRCPHIPLYIPTLDDFDEALQVQYDRDFNLMNNTLTLKEAKDEIRKEMAEKNPGRNDVWWSEGTHKFDHRILRDQSPGTKGEASAEEEFGRRSDYSEDAISLGTSQSQDQEYKQFLDEYQPIKEPTKEFLEAEAEKEHSLMSAKMLQKAKELHKAKEDESTPAPEIINNSNMSIKEKSAAVVNDFLQKNPDATEEDVAEVAQIVAEEEELPSLTADDLARWGLSTWVGAPTYVSQAEKIASAVNESGDRLTPSMPSFAVLGSPKDDDITITNWFVKHRAAPNKKFYIRKKNSSWVTQEWTYAQGPPPYGWYVRWRDSV